MVCRVCGCVGRVGYCGKGRICVMMMLGPWYGDCDDKCLWEAGLVDPCGAASVIRRHGLLDPLAAVLGLGRNPNLHRSTWQSCCCSAAWQEIAYFILICVAAPRCVRHLFHHPTLTDLQFEFSTPSRNTMENKQNSSQPSVAWCYAGGRVTFSRSLYCR